MKVPAYPWPVAIGDILRIPLKSLSFMQESDFALVQGAVQ